MAGSQQQTHSKVHHARPLEPACVCSFAKTGLNKKEERKGERRAKYNSGFRPRSGGRSDCVAPRGTSGIGKYYLDARHLRECDKCDSPAPLRTPILAVLLNTYILMIGMYIYIDVPSFSFSLGLFFYAEQVLSDSVFNSFSVMRAQPS